MNLLFRIFFLTAPGIFGSAITRTRSHAFAQPAAGDFSIVDAYIIETMHRRLIHGLALAFVNGSWPGPSSFSTC